MKSPRATLAKLNPTKVLPSNTAKKEKLQSSPKEKKKKKKKEIKEAPASPSSNDNAETPTADVDAEPTKRDDE